MNFTRRGTLSRLKSKLYHQMFEQAFILALDEAQGTTGDRTQALQIAEKARELILQDVIVPYNQLAWQGENAGFFEKLQHPGHQPFLFLAAHEHRIA